MRRMDYKVVVASVIALCVMVVCISVAYAALSSTLKINFGNVIQEPVTWNVGFSGSSYAGVAGSNNSSKTVCGSASITANTVTINPKIGGVGDSCFYEIPIKNSGTIDAKIDSIRIFAPDGVMCTQSATPPRLECGAIAYAFTYKVATSTAYPKVGDILAAGQSRTIDLSLKYIKPTTELVDFTQNGFKFMINYVQS